MTTDFSELTPRQTRRVVRFTEPMFLTRSSPRADWRDAKPRGKTLFVVRHFVTLMAGTARACSAVFETCLAEVPFRPARQLSEYKGKGASASRELFHFSRRKTLPWVEKLYSNLSGSQSRAGGGGRGELVNVALHCHTVQYKILYVTQGKTDLPCVTAPIRTRMPY